MNLIRKLAVVIVALGSASVAQADLIVLDFEGIAPDGSLVENITPYTEDGFLIDVDTGQVPGAIQSASRPGINDSGSDIFWWCGGCFEIIPITITQIGGSLFSVSSVELSNSDTGIMDPSLAIIATGTLSTGEQVSQTFDLVRDEWLTFQFGDEFADLSSLTFMANAHGRGDMAMDNLTLQESTSVPEPGTLALFAVGLAGIGLARRRKAAE